MKKKTNYIFQLPHFSPFITIFIYIFFSISLKKNPHWFFFWKKFFHINLVFIFVRVPLLVKDIGGFCWVYKSSIIGFIHWENFVCCNNTFVLNWIEVWEGRIEEQRTGGSQELELMRLHRQSMNPIRFHVPPSIFSHPFIKDSIMRLVSIAIIAFFLFMIKGIAVATLWCCTVVCKSRSARDFEFETSVVEVSSLIIWDTRRVVSSVFFCPAFCLV